MDFDKILYEASPLKEVVLRVDFMSNVEELYKRFPQELRDALSDDYKIFEKLQIVTKDIVATTTHLGISEKEKPEWNYYTSDRNRRMALAPGYFYISDKKYTSFEKLNAEFDTISKVLATEFKELQAVRLGLRYINHIDKREGDPLEWEDLINPDLLGILGRKDERNSIVRYFNQVAMNYEEFLLVFKFGLYNKDYPAPITDSRFILDMDAYHEGPLEMGELISMVNAYHEKIQFIFENAITDQARKSFS